MPKVDYSKWISSRLIAEHRRLDELVDNASSHIESMPPAEYEGYLARKTARCAVLSELMARIRSDPKVCDYIVSRHDSGGNSGVEMAAGEGSKLAAD